MNKVIALDIGGVCMNLHHDKCIQALNWQEGEIPIEVLAAAQKLETGMLEETDFLALMQRETDNQFTDQQLIECWNIILGDDIEGMPEVVAEICNLGYRFVFFSDTSEVHLLEIYRKLSFAHLVTGGVFSFKVGALKPDQKMYDAFEAEYGKPCFYIDDKPCNIEGGIAHGWTSHQFTSAEEFRSTFFYAMGE